MNLKDRVRGKNRMFVGEECEESPHRGKKTLFVSGFFPNHVIDKEARDHGCYHVYLGADFSPVFFLQVPELVSLGFEVTAEVSLEEVGSVLIDYLAEHGAAVMVRLPVFSKPSMTVLKMVDSTDLNKITKCVSCSVQELLEGGRLEFADFSKYSEDVEVLKGDE